MEEVLAGAKVSDNTVSDSIFDIGNGQILVLLQQVLLPLQSHSNISFSCVQAGFIHAQYI